MRLTATLVTLASSVVLTACMHKGKNPVDPYEPFNRKIHNFNMAFDATVLKPPAKLYKAVVPAPVRVSINNAYSNILMLPTVANDLLQAEWRYAIKDSWRFLINSTFGVGGLFDVAAKSFSLPPHYNDLGITFAKWGDKNSPYLVIPFLGPSTIRDGMSLPFDYMLTPYFYIPSSALLTSILGFRYVDLRSQFLDKEPLLNEAIDKYTFIRDAYLQYRNFQITGEQQDNGASIYVEEANTSDYVEEEPVKHATYHPASTGNSPKHG